MAETPHLTVRAHPDLLAALDRQAEAEDTTLSDLTRRALVEYLDARGGGRPRSHPVARRKVSAEA
jgi:hypothetical protein